MMQTIADIMGAFTATCVFMTIWYIGIRSMIGGIQAMITSVI